MKVLFRSVCFQSLVRSRCRSSRALLDCAVVWVILLTSGCRGTAGGEEVDTRLRRYEKTGRVEYAEGDLENAREAYRSAIRRAWLMDDPEAAGTNAYNLAAVLSSQSEYGLARDWLLDSRVELTRAGMSRGNVWLLEARIAQRQQRLGDVPLYVRRASLAPPPCEGIVDDKHADECKACGSQIPCVGDRLQQKQEAEQCRDEYAAQIQLASARYEAEQYNVAAARKHFCCACELAEDVCSENLRAELQDVAALIHIAQGEYLAAARHLDAETVSLRLAGNYREIPGVLRLAAAAYETAGLPVQAAERLVRVARILYARGEFTAAWKVVKDASFLAEQFDAEATEIRLSLLAGEMQWALQRRDGNSTDLDAEELGELNRDRDETAAEAEGEQEPDREELELFRQRESDPEASRPGLFNPPLLPLEPSPETDA